MFFAARGTPRGAERSRGDDTMNRMPPAIAILLWMFALLSAAPLLPLLRAAARPMPVPPRARG